MAEIPTIYYNQTATSTDANNRWWTLKDDTLFQSVWQVVKKTSENQSARSLNHIRYARLYHNVENYSLQPWATPRQIPNDALLSSRVTLNVVKSCVDTVASKIAKNRPKPQFLTSDGDYSLQTKAKNLTQFIEGLFYSGKFYEINAQAFIDACVFGTGAVYMYYCPDEKTIKIERVLIEELVVNEIDGRYKTPSQIHRVRMVARDALASMYPKHLQSIVMAPSGLDASSTTSTADVVKVIESWHLPSSKGAGDGKHSICIENATLFSEEYKHDSFPFVFQRWTDSLMGFWGIGLGEELLGIQLEINKLLRNIQISQHLMSVPQVWVESSSKVVAAQLNNEIGGIKKYTGNPPIFQVPPAMSAEVYNHLENLFSKAFQITGVSQLSASALKPAGIDAAVALREMSDIESERFMLVAQRYEESFMNLARMAINMCKALYEDEGININMKAPGKKSMTAISWKDVSLKDDQYIMKVWPTSLLPSSPAGKLQKVQEMMQAGFFDREDAIALLDFPDTEAVTSLITASRDDTLLMISNMLEKGIYDPPEPYMNLQLAMKLTQSAYIKARMNGYEDDKLELLRRFMSDLQTLMAPPPLAEAPVVPPVDMGMPVPGIEGAPLEPIASPEAAPTSELLPV